MHPASHHQQCYFGIRRNVRLAESLAAANGLADRIAAENQQLQAEAAVRERDDFEVGEFLRRDLAERRHALVELAERKQEVSVSQCAVKCEI